MDPFDAGFEIAQLREEIARLEAELAEEREYTRALASENEELMKDWIL